MTPQLFGNYVLLERLAAGGMGEVFLAKAGPKGFERYFAIKRILTQHEGSERFVQMLMDEAKISISLLHPNIAQVFEFGELGGSFYLAMEYVQGLSVGGLLETGVARGIRMPYNDAISIALQVCRALHYAHERLDADGKPLGLVHRDVSPQNILIDQSGLVKLIDFGIAKAAGSRTQTEAGLIKGKLGYMSPEQARGEPLDRRSDIFALGVVLYECLSYQPMFRAENTIEQLRRVQHGDLPSFDHLSLGRIGPQLVALLERALAPQRERRYATAAQMERDLAALLNAIDPAYTPHALARLVHQLDQNAAARRDRMQSYAEIDASQLLPTIEVSLAARESLRPAPQPERARPAADTEVDRRDQPSVLFTPRRLAFAGAGLLAALVLATAAWLFLRTPARDRAEAPRSPPLAALPQPASPAALVRSVTVDSTPAGARLFIDEVERGTTPIMLGDIPTERRIPMRLEKSGFASEERWLEPGSSPMVLEVRLRRRAREPAEAAVKSGCVAVAAEPWAEVLVKDKSYGQTPIKCVALPAGRHTITLSNPARGVTKQIEVNVVAGQTTRVIEQL